MSKQLLRDAGTEPTRTRITECLGTTGADYETFTALLQTQDVVLDWRYYKDGGAWLGKGLYRWETARGTKKEMTVLWLSIWEETFKVTLYIPEKHREAAVALPLSAGTAQMLMAAQTIGKLKFFPLIFEIRAGTPVDDLHTLIAFRKTLK